MKIEHGCLNTDKRFSESKPRMPMKLKFVQKTGIYLTHQGVSAFFPKAANRDLTIAKCRKTYFVSVSPDWALFVASTRHASPVWRSPVSTIATHRLCLACRLSGASSTAFVKSWNVGIKKRYYSAFANSCPASLFLGFTVGLPQSCLGRTRKQWHFQGQLVIAFFIGRLKWYPCANSRN